MAGCSSVLLTPPLAGRLYWLSRQKFGLFRKVHNLPFNSAPLNTWMMVDSCRSHIAGTPSGKMSRSPGLGSRIFDATGNLGLQANSPSISGGFEFPFGIDLIDN
jgi:hypothetical protein